jgi:hypothetical protein
MTNVRNDANGLSKAPVYDSTVFLAHRSAVVAVHVRAEIQPCAPSSSLRQ